MSMKFGLKKVTIRYYIKEMSNGCAIVYSKDYNMSVMAKGKDQTEAFDKYRKSLYASAALSSIYRVNKKLEESASVSTPEPIENAELTQFTFELAR